MANVKSGGYMVIYFNAIKSFIVGELYWIDNQQLIATNVTTKYLRGRVI